MPFSKPLLVAPARLASGFILISVLLDMAALGISITVLPQLIGALAGGAAAGWINGAFVGVWALVQFAASMAGLGLDYVVMAVAPNLAWLLVGRILSGVTASSFSIAYAYVADVTPEENRAAAFGRLGAAFGLGFVLGPAVGGLLGEVSVRAPFWAAAAFSLGNAVFGLLVLPESLPKDRRSPFAWRKANPLGSLQLLRSHPELAGLSWTHLLSQLAGSSISSVYVLYVVRRYGWSMQSVGFSLAFVGLVVAVVQGALLGRITARLGEKRTLLVGLAAGVLSLLGFGLSPAGWMIPVLIVLFGFWGLQGPATASLMSRRVSGSEQGRLQGAVASLTSLADGTGPFLFGAVFSLTAATRLGAGWSGAAFVAAAAVLLATLLFTASLLARPDAVAAEA